MSPAIGVLKKKSEANRKGQKRNLSFEEIFFFLYRVSSKHEIILWQKRFSFSSKDTRKKKVFYFCYLVFLQYG